VHCHQQALVGRDATAATLRAAQLHAQVLDAGCCGMAGAFGFDKEHFGVSIDIGERMLLPAVRQAPDDTVVIADGFSCREQIRQTTGRRPYHFAEVIWHALGGRDEDGAVART
jgi:Fe-S oxidoreductase